jgi:group I intron endonuclease
MPMGCLYKLTSPSGKSYIGISSKSTEARWAKHIEHALGKRENGALYNALRKYGPHSFKVQTLAIAKFDYLRELEKRAIRSFGTLYPNGYNVALGGEGWIGPRSVSFKTNASLAQKKRYSDPAQRESLRLFGVKARAAHAANCASKRIDGKAIWQVRKQQATLKAQLSHDEFKKVHSDRVKAAMMMPNVREKVLACAKERAANPEWREKISASKKGHKSPPYTGESHQARSDGAKRMWIRRKAKNVS